MYKFCHCLTKPIITRIIVSLVLENVVVRVDVNGNNICAILTSFTRYPSIISWKTGNKLMCYYFEYTVRILSI